MTVICPVCGGDRAKDMTDVKALARARGMIEYTPNPGGAEMLFRDHGRLQLGDQCNTCDEKSILEFLGVSP